MSLWKTLAKSYKANVARQLRGYGLRLEDIFNESHPEYYNVVSRMSPQEKLERDNRFRRAIDISFKRSELPLEYTSEEDVFKQEMLPRVFEAVEEAEEREFLTGKRESPFV